MKLDTTFAREIKKVANGDGSDEHMRTFRKTLRMVKAELSCVGVRERYNECVKKYGRVPVAICTAATVVDRQDRLESKSITWALEVLKHWTNRPNTTLYFAVIEDGLHPTRIEEYAAPLMQVTTEEAG